MHGMRMLALALDPRLHRLAERLTWVLKGHLTVPMVAGTIVLAMLVWVLAGFRLRGIALLLWLLVPVFALAASVAVAGPGRLFDKRAHEGRVVIALTRKDAITQLDLVGLWFAALSVVLAVALRGWRVRSARPRARRHGQRVVPSRNSES